MNEPIITAQQLVVEARKLRGVKWSHQGRTHFGVDCIGLIVLATRNAGLDLSELLGVRDHANYRRDPDPMMLALVQKHCTPITQPIAGCLIVMQFPRDKHPRHFGLFTAEGNMIHANSKEGRVVEHGYRPPWPRWQHSLWRIPGVSYA